MNYTYIVNCEDGTYYTGWTNDLHKRMHNHFIGSGAKYTKSHKMLGLVYYEEHEDKITCMQREYQIKKLKRGEKEMLVKGIVEGKELLDSDKIHHLSDKSEMKIYRCNKCGRVLVSIFETNHPLKCCEEMELLKVHEEDELFDNHSPIIARGYNGIRVEIGEDIHQNYDDDYISFVILVSDSGYRISYLSKEDKPIVDIYPNEHVKKVYSYCTKHGLWKVSI